jgi:hypothetical protein
MKQLGKRHSDKINVSDFQDIKEDMPSLYPSHDA